jgi:hypothetical protein
MHNLDRDAQAQKTIKVIYDSVTSLIRMCTKLQEMFRLGWE